MRKTCLLLLTLAGCTGIPDGVVAVEDFELSQYLGTWYEIARLDHRFERGLSDIRADYSLNSDGSVKVLNSGYSAEAGERESAEGQAEFVETPTVGRLQVSFFGPFYGAYNIIALDKPGYRYAMIAGPDRDYLWILARDPQLPAATLKALLDQARTLGFATDQLIYDWHPPSEQIP